MNLSLEIRSMDTNFSELSQITCDSYPKISFSSNITNILFASVISLKLSSISMINPLQKGSQIHVNDTKSFELSRVCINISDADIHESQKPSFLIRNTNEVVFNSIMVNRTSDSQNQTLFQIETADSLTINDTKIAYVDVSTPNIYLFNPLIALSNSKKVIVNDIAFAFADSASLVDVIHISNSIDVSVSNVTIGMEESLPIERDIINLQNLFFCSNLTNLTINNVRFNPKTEAVIGNQLFYLEDIQFIEIQYLLFDNSQFRSLHENSYLFTYVSHDSIQTINSSSQNLFALDSVDIWYTSFTKIGFLNVNSANTAEKKLFSISNFTFEKSVLRSHGLLIFNAKEALNYSETRLSDFYFKDSTFDSAKVGFFQSGDYLKVNNFICEDSKFLTDGRSNYYFLEFKMNIMVEIKDFNFNKNVIYSNTILLVSKFPQHLLIVDSNITSNRFIDSSMVRIESANIFETDKFSGYSVVLLQNITISDLWANNSMLAQSLFDLSGPHVFMLDSYFKNIMLISGTLATISGVKFNTSKFANIRYVNKTFADYSKLRAFLLFDISSNMSITPAYFVEIEFQYRFQSNYFENCSMSNDDQITDGMAYSIESLGLIEVKEFLNVRNFVLLIDNKIVKSDSGKIDMYSFISIKAAMNLHIQDNKFEEIIGKGTTLLKLEKINNLVIIGNILNKISGPGFVSLVSQQISQVTFSDNILLESALGSSFISYSVRIQASKLVFANNSLHNCTFTRTDRELIKISIEKSTNAVIFQNLTMKDFRLTKLADKPLELIDASAAISVSIGKAQFKLVNSTISVTDMTFYTSVLFVDAESTKILSSEVLLSGMSVNNNIIISSNEIVFENTSIVDDVTIDNNQHSVILIFGRAVLKISFINNRVLFSSKSSSQLLQIKPYDMSGSSTEIILKNNTFNSITKHSIGAWINFKTINLQRAMISDNIIMLLQDAISAGNWIRFLDCSGEVVIANNRVFLEGDNNGLILSSISNSTNLSAVIANNQIIHSANKDLGKQNHIQLLNADSGNVTVQDFFLTNITLSTSVIVLKNSNLPLMVQLINISILNVNQPRPNFTEIDSKFISLINTESKGIILLQDNKLSFCNTTVFLSAVNCRFQNINIDGKGGVINIESEASYLVSLINTMFINISSEEGSALRAIPNNPDKRISIANSHIINIINSSFIKNSVLRSGAEIYIQDAKINLAETYFESNYTKKDGSTIFLVNVSEPSNIIAHLKQNSNLQIKDIRLGLYKFEVNFKDYYYPWSNEKLYLINQGTLVVKNVTAFQVQFIDLMLKDVLDRNISDSSSSIKMDAIVTLVNQSHTSIKNETLTTFCKESICQINDRYNVLGGYLGDVAILLIKYTSDMYSFETKIEIHYRDCLPGEIKDSQQKKCVPCPPGKYSLNSNDYECKYCLDGAEECFGSSIILKKGYWRRNVTTDDIHPCEDAGSSESPSRCEGGIDSP